MSKVARNDRNVMLWFFCTLHFAELFAMVVCNFHNWFGFHAQKNDPSNNPVNSRLVGLLSPCGAVTAMRLSFQIRGTRSLC